MICPCGKDFIGNIIREYCYECHPKEFHVKGEEEPYDPLKEEALTLRSHD